MSSLPFLLLLSICSTVYVLMMNPTTKCLQFVYVDSTHWGNLFWCLPIRSNLASPHSCHQGTSLHLQAGDFLCPSSVVSFFPGPVVFIFLYPFLFLVRLSGRQFFETLCLFLFYSHVILWLGTEIDDSKFYRLFPQCFEIPLHYPLSSSVTVEKCKTFWAPIIFVWLYFLL